MDMIKINSIIKTVGFSTSISEANRLIEQDAVWINGDLVDDCYGVAPSSCFVLEVGKTKKANVTIGPHGVRWSNAL